MNTPEQIAQHLKAVHFGGNWTSVNLKDTLAGVSWQQATTPVTTLNTIAALVYHINYYIDAVLKVLQGGTLEAKDAYSFDHPPVTSDADWERMLTKIWSDAETFASLIAQLPEQQLQATFIDEKYGSYYRNLQGIIEHTHYHMGQIVIIKKLLPGV